VHVRTAEGTTSDSLVYVFGCCVFCRGDDGDSLTGEKFCGKNLLINLFCRVEKRLPVSHKMNDMKKL